MKAKNLEDFKRIAAAIAIYFGIAVLVFPVFHLIKGDFSWKETLINAAINLIVVLFMGVLYYFGSHIPSNNQK